MGQTVEGYCCWPGQIWSATFNRCDGAPICPAGFVGVGAECRILAPPVQSADTHAPTQQRESRTELVVTGAALFGVGWIGSIGAGMAYAANGGWHEEITFSYLAPIVGAPIGTAQLSLWGDDRTLAWFGSVASVVFQVTGMVLFIVGLAAKRPIATPTAELADGVEVSLAGNGLRLTF